MIECIINGNEQLQIIQRDLSPTVYLDHWALCQFSEEKPLAGRLTAALKARNGTLALSWLNLAEFTRMTREEQARNAENLLEGILPQVFFIDVDRSVVI